MTDANENVPVPRVHYCGTPGSVLLASTLRAADAVRDAMTALAAAAPHARDYRPQGEKAYTWAHVSHSEQLDALSSVLSWLARQAEGIDAQMK
jgi:hypothetical protein